MRDVSMLPILILIQLLNHINKLVFIQFIRGSLRCLEKNYYRLSA